MSSQNLGSSQWNCKSKGLLGERRDPCPGGEGAPPTGTSEVAGPVQLTEVSGPEEDLGPSLVGRWKVGP